MQYDSNLYQNVLIKVLSQQDIKVTFENLSIESPNEIVEKASFAALHKIREVLDNDGLQDFECVERIIAILEEIGTDGGSRHDF